MARRTVQVRAYADRIVVRCGEEVVAEHPRYFGRNRTIYDPRHYLPVLARKPDALRNGAPFQDWDLPPALARLRRKLGYGDDADRRFVRVLLPRFVELLTIWLEELAHSEDDEEPRDEIDGGRSARSGSRRRGRKLAAQVSEDRVDCKRQRDGSARRDAPKKSASLPIRPP